MEYETVAMLDNDNNSFNATSSSPMISVLMPVYNGGENLRKAIDSILNQTYYNFELIIIDDGSTDNSLDILIEYRNLDNRILLISRENRGLVLTLNESIKLARAPWVARMDQDDISLPLRFEKQLDWLEKSGADICGSWVKYFVGENNICKYFETDEAIKYDMLFKSPFAHPSVIMRTELVKKLNYDKSCEHAEDYDLWVRAAMSGCKMSNVQEVLLMYRRHTNQMTSKSFENTNEVSRAIRKRYWKYVSLKQDINENESLQVQKFVNLEGDVTMSLVNLAFGKLLNQSVGEAKRVLSLNIGRTYLKAALIIKDLDLHWRELIIKNPINKWYLIYMKLLFILKFRIKKEGFFYSNLVGIYKFFFN